MTTDITTARHWDSFYTSAEVHRLRPPSQFGAFMIGETPSEATVVDVGCGSGRDALFFASHRHRVVGVDGSTAAIAHCSATAEALGLDAKFLHAEVQAPALAENLRAMPAVSQASSLLVYARFFLHAITESDEDALFDLVGAISTPGRTQFAVEFRTQRDATLPKSTAQHYRRFIDPITLLAKALGRGMAISYFVEGFGFAKYGDDDAHVARCVFKL
jgi:SAM-dependent methyltransferase